MKTAFLFPGQGAQFAGMGADIVKSFPVAADIFEKANQILDFDLRQICFEGPAEKLNETIISQPAIFTVSAAILEVLKNLKPDIFSHADVTAGLSMGEYTALYAAGIFNFEDALVLVQKRGEAMQEAADATEGAMVSIIGLDEEKVSRLCSDVLDADVENDDIHEDELLVPVNFNCPGQIVVSGTKGACKRAKDLAGKYGAIKAVRLDVAGAFHTKMMDSAAEKLKQALSNCNISEPSDTQIIANIDAQYYQSSEKIAKGLTGQLTSSILWQQCMERLLDDGVEKFYEIGPGRVLTGLMKRINRKIKVVNVSSSQAIKEVLAS